MIDPVFTDIARELEPCYVDNIDAWIHSPFLWLRQLSAKKKGAAMEAMVRQWCNVQGFPPNKTSGSESDCSIGGVLTEIKGSTLWNSGEFQFNQIRQQKYDMLIFLGISPNDVHLWCPPKLLAMEHAKPQHGGEAGQDTFFLKFKAADPPRWIRGHGGTLADAKLALRHQVLIYAPLLYDHEEQ